ncbi:unnamed protein product [Lactuca saligna]|uniref:Uncharacterized protein n=1 Tax=Lactuca saligna TaxID=75948 RepID=A0AA35ZJ79_LACSI|nr:unnamed protein product [Lactuca saligna]
MVGLDASEWGSGIANVCEKLDELSKGNWVWPICPNGFGYGGSGLANMYQGLDLLSKGASGLANMSYQVQITDRLVVEFEEWVAAIQTPNEIMEAYMERS